MGRRKNGKGVVSIRLTSKVGAEELRQAVTIERGKEMEYDFIRMLDRWHSEPEVWDSDLERQIAAMNYEILRNPVKLDWGPKGSRYFSPSQVDACARALYMKLTGAPKDKQRHMPHQGRWQRAGTIFGEMIQRDLLFIEKHYEEVTGEVPPFEVERVTVNGYRFPAWERFAETLVRIDYGGHTIALKGQPDGILRYKDGTRVGLEIKSKQTTAAKTGSYAMSGPEEKHVKQVVAYSLMYGLDDYLIVYGNLAKRSWNMTEEEYRRNPDLRAFHVRITDADRLALLDRLAGVMDAVESRTPPPLELDKWAFNNWKTACALSLTEDELKDLHAQVKRVQRSKMPAWMKQNYQTAWTEIQEIRNGGGGEWLAI